MMIPNKTLTKKFYFFSFPIDNLWGICIMVIMETSKQQYELGQIYRGMKIVRSWENQGNHPERINLVVSKDVYFDDQRKRPYFSCLKWVSVDVKTGIEHSSMMMDKQEFNVPSDHELWKEVSNG